MREVIVLLRILLTVAVAAVFGFVFFKIKVPAGFMVGAIVGVAAMNIIFGLALMTEPLKIFAQSMAGAFIGVL